MLILETSEKSVPQILYRSTRNKANVPMWIASSDLANPLRSLFSLLISSLHVAMDARNTSPSWCSVSNTSGQCFKVNSLINLSVFAESQIRSAP
jgi:hypothetical protein